MCGDTSSHRIQVEQRSVGSNRRSHWGISPKLSKNYDRTGGPHPCTPKTAISLSLQMCPHPAKGSLAIRIQVWNSVRPGHLFGRNLDHDYSSDSPVKGSGRHNQLPGILLHTIARNPNRKFADRARGPVPDAGQLRRPTFREPAQAARASTSAKANFRIPRDPTPERIASLPGMLLS
jgi:hypothetical protein